MQTKIKRQRTEARHANGVALAVPSDLHPMVATKLWDNPCWLSFRANYIAHHFNQPIYDYVLRTREMTAPEHVVLYAVGLKEGITAEDVVASSARPKNTLSRAVNSLIAKKLLLRRNDPQDGRRRLLYLTRTGRRIIDETVPLFVAQEKAMIAVLSGDEQRTLNHLLTKIVLNQNAWIKRITQEMTP